MTFPPEADLISGDNPVYIGDMNAGESRTVNWTLVFAVGGVFNLDVNASGYRRDTGAYVEKHGSATVTVRGPVHNIDTTFNYDTIQAAIDAPQTLGGHTILVDAGTYYEHVSVYKCLTLIGENRETTIIDGNGTFVTIVHITANNVSIRGLTIQNDAPIVCLEGGGIYITNTTKINVVDNIITNTQYPINLKNSTRNTVIGNTIIGNDVGIQFLDQHSSNNTIYHNNFINNSWQVSNFGATNTWDNRCEGNYWTNYNGTDLDGDGTGDAPYVIDGNNTDNHPLMNRYWNPADVNHDLKVNIYDVVLICITYGSTPLDSNWNCHCDIAESYGVIDIYDVVTACANYGKKMDSSLNYN